MQATTLLQRIGLGEHDQGMSIRDKSMVAFKYLDGVFGQKTCDLWKEITIFSFHKHENLIHLLVFCDWSDEKIIVYEYTYKRSLDLYFNSNDRTWVRYLKIYIKTARGLDHLHNLVETKRKSIAS